MVTVAKFFFGKILALRLRLLTSTGVCDSLSFMLKTTSCIVEIHLHGCPGELCAIRLFAVQCDGSRCMQRRGVVPERPRGALG